jgi:hypothetical protein
MNIELLENKLNKIKNDLKKDKNNEIIQNIKNNNNFKNLDENYKNQINNEYFLNLPEHEKIYQKKNEEYKELISYFSKSYLEICDFYVGPELPRKTFLDSKKDVTELFSLFIIGALCEPYINAYHDKYINTDK